MQKIAFLCVGKLKESWAREAAAFYADRLNHVIKLEIVELPASKETDPERQRSEESKRLLDAARKIDGDMWVLDEKGKAMTSPAFAKAIEQAQDDGRTIIFLLGGAYGLIDEVRSAGKLLKLSDMTLPHELCRVFFLEQLYRAIEINRGSGYHH